MLSAVAPTAFTYSGTDPNKKRADPTMNRQVIALLRPAGLIVMQLPSRTAFHVYRTKARDTSPMRDESVAPDRESGSQCSKRRLDLHMISCGSGNLDHLGESITGRLRSKNSVSPTLSLFISSICACSSGGISLRSPSRASASEVKYMTMV
jgi:hypothetical protein